MPLYVIERNFAERMENDAEGVRELEEINADEGVRWVFSFLRADKLKSYCVYDGPTPEAIRRVAADNALPVDAITEVRVLDPYFYTGGAGR